MLEFKLQLLIILISLIFSGFIFHFIRKGILDLRYTIVWIIVGVFFLLFSLIPQIIFTISETLGFTLPVNALFLTGMLFTLVIVFTLTVTVSSMSSKITLLAQEIALLKEEVKHMERKKNAN